MMIRNSNRFLAFLTLGLALLLASGCASRARISHFDSFATAGNHYATTMDELLKQSADVLIDTNSRKLIETQADFAGSVTEESLEEQDEAIKENLVEIGLLRRQVDLLSRYFDSLAALATTGAAQDFGAQMRSTVSSLNGLSESLTSSKLFAKAEATQDVVGGVGELVVRGIQVRALERELEERKQTIAEVLRLHQLLLSAVRAQIEADNDFVQQREYEAKVIEPLIQEQGPSDPAAWMEQRRRLLSPVPLDELVQGTIAAIDGLQIAWGKLLTNDLSLSDVTRVIDDLEPILAGIHTLRAQPVAAPPTS